MLSTRQKEIEKTGNDNIDDCRGRALLYPPDMVFGQSRTLPLQSAINEMFAKTCHGYEGGIS